MAVCAGCGQTNPDHSRFCSSCDPLESKGVGSRRDVTVVFCDLVGSTSLAGRLDAESLHRILARYFETMRGAVERHGGRVEKFIGDAVMAVFGVPQVHEDDPLRAVRAATDMQRELALLRGDLERKWGVSLDVRIGVASGRVVTGTDLGPRWSPAPRSTSRLVSSRWPMRGRSSSPTRPTGLSATTSRRNLSVRSRSRASATGSARID